MRKRLLLATVLGLSFISLKSQVTIGSEEKPHPSALLELKNETGDKGFLGPSVPLKDIWDDASIPNPIPGLMVFNTADSDPQIVINIVDRVKAERYYYWSGEKWNQLIGEDQLKTNIEFALAYEGIQRPALYTLDGNILIQKESDIKGIINLLANIPPGSSVFIPLKERVNYTNGTVTTESDTDGKLTLNFKPGVYSITFAYEFVSADLSESGETPPAGCTLSSYFMDFPYHRLLPDNTIEKSQIRIVSNSPHNELITSNHGGTITFATRLYEEILWPVKLGCGNAGNCERAGGFAMPNRSTYLYISRLGDAAKTN